MHQGHACYCDQWDQFHPVVCGAGPDLTAKDHQLLYKRSVAARSHQKRVATYSTYVVCALSQFSSCTAAAISRLYCTSM